MDDLTPFDGTIDALAGLGIAIVFGYIVIELLWLRFGGHRLDLRIVRMTLLGLVANGLAAPVLTRLIGPVSLGVAAMAGSELGFFQLGFEWYGWVYGLIAYEFFYWLQHWLAHKVRLLWCLHSPHHAPGAIHMAIGANHHFLESLVYFPIFLGFLPAILGVDPRVVVVLNVLDTIWGSYLHLSDEVVRVGRYGWVGRFMQTPSHHRVHHARNPRYMDRNYNSITLFWDWVFGTLEPLREDEPVDYGITREVDAGRYWDVHFGEFAALYRDLRGASTVLDALGYLFRPPGWCPGDPTHTASSIRAALLADEGGPSVPAR